MEPSIGRIVHYVSYGTPGGEYTSRCRAAIITELYPESMRNTVGLAVMSPEGILFSRGIGQSEDEHVGGTWHWPERV